MKALGLDIGDVWVGSALSDAVGIISCPYRTVTLQDLDNFLTQLFEEESIGTVVVGHPITVGGMVSKQTEVVEKIFEKLRARFPQKKWILWDERFSTKRALSLMKERKKQREKEHSIAAAFILQSYLDYRSD